MRNMYAMCQGKVGLLCGEIFCGPLNLFPSSFILPSTPHTQCSTCDFMAVPSVLKEHELVCCTPCVHNYLGKMTV